MKKRIISIVLCLALCLSCLPMNAFAEDDTDELSVAETDASELLPSDENVQSAEICDTLPAVEGFSDDLAELEAAQIILSDSFTGVTVKLTGAQLPEGVSAESVSLSVSALSEEESSALFSETVQGKQFLAYDISLTDAEGDIQPVAAVQVGIPVPDDFGGKLSVLHRQDGNIETISCDVKDGVAWFEAVHFSPYALVSEISHTADYYENADETADETADASDADETADASDAAEKNPDVSSLALGGDSAVGVQFDEEDTAAVLRLLGTTEGLSAFSLGGDEWSFDMYYINYGNALATTKNQTTLDLIGNGMEPQQNLKYQFEFHNSTDYEIGDVSITIPRSLYIDRTGNPVNPTDIGVPAAPAVSKASSFNYHVETVDGVEYLVFTNCKKIIAGSNNLIQIFYKLDDMMTVDETSWDIRAQLCIGGQDVSGDIVLHGSMDTETNLYFTNKEPYIPTTEGSIYPEVYTWNQVKQWSNLQGEAPDDFDDYRYVLWRTELWGNASQPWNLTVVDTPSHDGEVIGQSLTEYKEGNNIFAVFDDGVFTFGEEPWYKLARNEELDGLFERIYEDNVSGKLSDERFTKMSIRYESEQKENSDRIKKLTSEIEKQSNRTTSTNMFISLVRKYTRARKLTPRMLNELVEKIEVYNAEKIDGEWVQRLRIHYNCVGEMTIPKVLPLPVPAVTVNTRKGVYVSYAANDELAG